MADVGEVSYSIDVDTDDVIKGFNKTKQANEKMSRSFDKTDSSSRKMDRGLKSVSNSSGKAAFSITKLAGAIGAAIVAQRLWNLAVDASNVQRDFADSLADLSAITGATGKDLAYMSDQAKKLGSSTKFTASQVATSFKLMASAKPDLLENANALASVTEQSLLLATAAGVDLAQSASIVGTALNQFSADADEAARFVNVLAAGAKLGASEVGATAEALKNSGVAAKNAGLSFEEANATIQVLASSGIKAGEAGTALRSIFLSLETQANRKLKPSIVGLSAALDELGQMNLDAEASAKLFGKEYSTISGILVDNRTKVSDLTKALTGTNTAQEQAAIKSETLKNKQLELQSAIEGLQITIGEQLNPTVLQSTEFMTELTKAVDHFFQSLNKGSVAQITSEMAAVDWQIERIKEKMNPDSWWNEMFYTEEMRANDVRQLGILESKMQGLRDSLNKAQGTTSTGGFIGPLLPNDFVKSSGQGVTPTVPVTPTPPAISSATTAKQGDPFSDTFGGDYDGFATGISKAIIQENETLLEELNRQRELILEFQELGIGDAEKHAQALIEIDKQQASEKIRMQQEILGSSSQFFEASADLIGTFAGESSGAYKALFAVSKGFAIANAALQLQTAIANASALPWPANFPAIASAVTIGAGIASSIGSLSYSGGRETGGGVLGGNMYQMGEKNKPEILQTGAGLAVIPGDKGKVFNQNQLDQINGGGGNGGNMTITQEFNIQGTGDKDLIVMLEKTARQAQDAIRAEYANSMSDKKGTFFSAQAQNNGNGTTNGRPT